MKSYCPCEISNHCGLCSTNTQKSEKTSDEAIKADATYTNFHSRNLSSPETDKQKTAICFHRCSKPELPDLLLEWQKRLLWVTERLSCSHYALCMCGLFLSFSSLRWTVRWWVQTCFLMGYASLLGAGRKTLDVGVDGTFGHHCGG